MVTEAWAEDELLLPLSRTVWVRAALGALAIHAGIAAIVLRSMQNGANDELGAPALVISVDLLAPRRDPSDLRAGPDADASAPAPAEVAQKEEIKQTELPKDLLTETANPDIIVLPADAKKPDDDLKTPTAQAQPSERSVAMEAAAVPSVQTALESRRSAAPSPGTGESALRERVTWEKELAAHFDKYKRYPADREMQTAEVVVNFVLDEMGHVVSSRIAKSSGDAAFDEAALDMLQRSDPVPPPPPLVADASLSFTLPVIFHVKGQN
jgi:periplasmic protein TonB